MANRRFPLVLGLVAVTLEACLSLVIWLSAPPQTRWLGDTIQNSSDQAVYLSEILQGASGHLLLHNLYAVESHAPRFDLVWSTLGWIAQSGLSPLLIHEIARWIFTILLAFAVYAAAASVASTERNAHLASILLFCGVGTGWIHSVALGMRHLWTPLTYTAPDLVTEFAIAPILMGGAHMILSLALLVTGVRLTWNAWADRSSRTAWRASLVLGTLFLFHPYFVVLFGILCLIAFAWNCTGLSFPRFLRLALPFAASILPASAVYVPLFYDPVFRTHHLTANILPLGGWAVWIATLFPFIIALVWRWKKRVELKRSEYWLVAWTISAIIAMLLPLPWIRKLTEGLIIPCILLTLPAWTALRDRLIKKPLSHLMSAALLLCAALGPLHLFSSQLVWISKPDTKNWFYASQNLFDAWSALRTSSSPTSTIITSDDMWVNVWTPAYAERTTWVAHDHETPTFWDKRRQWQNLMTTADPVVANRILDDAYITHLLTTSSSSAERFRKFLSPASWFVGFRSGSVTLFQRKD